MNLLKKLRNVIPAKAGIHKGWIPACAGMTIMLFFAISAQGFQAEPKLANPAKEAMAQTLFHEIRCVVCTGESLAESSASMAVDMRRFIRSELEHGQTPAQIKAQLVANYGQRILQTPPIAPKTYFLWFFPLVMILLGASIVVKHVKKSSKIIQPPASS